MPEGSFRLTIIAAISGLVCVTGSSVAHAQYFFGFGAPQQFNTARGAIQLAPGWRVANAPVRTSGGYRVAVRSETGEQRNMLIGANGALAITRPYEPRAMRAPARPIPQLQRPTHAAEPKKPKVARVAPRAPAAPATKRTPEIQPASTSSDSVKPQPRATAPNDLQQKARTPAPLDVQAPGFAHGVPINPLD